MSLYSDIVTMLIIIFGTINIARIVFLMVGSDIYGLKETLAKKRTSRTPRLPTFSVVIPAHNEEKTILHSLQSIVHAHYPQHKLQAIVVDDGSTDATASLVKDYLRINERSDIKLVQQSRRGKAHALNNGIQHHSTGELVMCLDADSAIAPNALMNAARHFEDSRVVAVASNVKIRPAFGLLNLIQRFEYVVCHQMKRAHTIFNIEYIIGGVGSTFRRSALEKVDYFDTDTVTEDIDLTMKFLQLGSNSHRVIYGSDVVTYTESVLSIQGLIRQRFRWKYGRCQTFLKNSSLFFDTSKKNSKLLTWGYLPFAIFSDFAFFFEPFMVSYILYIILWYHDWVTLLGALILISSYISINIVAEDTIHWKEKLVLLPIAPSMYFFFYLLSFVEYVALIRSYSQFRTVRKSIGSDNCGWKHVERAAIRT